MATTAGRPVDVASAPVPGAERADRILDAAAELLVRFGYRKVTVEDVAHRARVGKGTVYLHWRTKRHLFEALVVREAVGYVEALVDALRADPETVLPHRLMATSYLVVMGRPVLRLLATGEAPELRAGVLAGGHRQEELLTVERMFEVMTRYGLFRDDIPHPRYTVTAATAGFYLIDEIDPPAADLEPRAKADALAYAVRHAFEPTTRPGRDVLAAAAAEAIALSEELIPPYREWIYAYDRRQRQS